MANDDLIVNEASDFKPNPNHYEQAKMDMFHHIQKIKNHTILYFDWISTTPNMAPNFSLNKMIHEGAQHGTISYSPGPFGRPLLDGSSAGEYLFLAHDNALHEKQDRILVPGIFITFEEFALSAQKALAQLGISATLQEYTNTPPDWLKSRIISDTANSIGYDIDKGTVLQALDLNSSMIANNL